MFITLSLLRKAHLHISFGSFALPLVILLPHFCLLIFHSLLNFRLYKLFYKLTIYQLSFKQMKKNININSLKNLILILIFFLISQIIDEVHHLLFFLNLFFVSLFIHKNKKVASFMRLLIDIYTACKSIFMSA